MDESSTSLMDDGMVTVTKVQKHFTQKRVPNVNLSRRVCEHRKSKERTNDTDATPKVNPDENKTNSCCNSMKNINLDGS
jgi:hypothetical protein